MIALTVSSLHGSSGAEQDLHRFLCVVQYDCVVGTSHIGQVCVPLCPNSEGTPACIPCEDVRSNCAWVSPSQHTLHRSSLCQCPRDIYVMPGELEEIQLQTSSAVSEL